MKGVKSTTIPPGQRREARTPLIRKARLKQFQGRLSLATDYSVRKIQHLESKSAVLHTWSRSRCVLIIETIEGNQVKSSLKCWDTQRHKYPINFLGIHA